MHKRKQLIIWAKEQRNLTDKLYQKGEINLAEWNHWNNEINLEAGRVYGS
jgi:hypothetical protein